MLPAYFALDHSFRTVFVTGHGLQEIWLHGADGTHVRHLVMGLCPLCALGCMWALPVNLCALGTCLLYALSACGLCPMWAFDACAGWTTSIWRMWTVSAARTSRVDYLHCEYVHCGDYCDNCTIIKLPNNDDMELRTGILISLRILNSLLSLR